MRTLALRLSPIDGESLPGWIARYAHAFGLEPGDVAAALGLGGERRFDGLRLSTAQAEGAAAASGIAPEAIRGMTPERYAGRAFSSGGAGGGLLPRPVLAQEVSPFSSRACPACLREQGAWLLRWQLGWSLLCTHHRLLLISSCPACGGRLGPSRRARWASDEHGELRDPLACRNPVGGRLCRFPVAEAKAIDLVADPELVEAQRRLDAVLVGATSPRFAGVEMVAPAWLGDLHALALLLRGYPEFTATRSPALLRGAAGDPRARGRLLLEVATLAAVLPEAIRLADLPDEEALVAGLREVLERRHRHDGGTLPKLRALHTPSERLAGALRHAAQTAGFAHVSTRLGFDPHAYRRPTDLDPRLEARHVPQLFWASDYERSLEPLFDFDDFSPWFGRRFCSTLLTRMLAPLGWQDAVRHLELPGNYRHGGYQVTQSKLSRQGRFEELVARIKAAANGHAAGPLIDYRARRALLSDWEGIDPESWLYLQPVRRPERWRVDPPKRRAHASIWLWCELTSGHERAAPVPLPGRPGKDLNEHTGFRHHFLPPLRERLLILGELLLVTPADARQTLTTRLIAALHERGLLAERLRLDTLEPSITRRVLAHVAAHTGVDIATLTTAAVGRQAPAAVTHARLLVAALLRRTTLASWEAIASVLPGGGRRLASNDRAYQATLDRDPTSTGELEALIGRVRDLGTPAPVAPEVPHRRRMRAVAEAIGGAATELFGTEDDIGMRAGALACREHTDLTWAEIAALFETRAHPTLFQSTVATRRRDDPDFDRRFRQLVDHAGALRRSAGFADANLQRGLAGCSENTASRRGARHPGARPAHRSRPRRREPAPRQRGKSIADGKEP
jgi:hypothetical protein